MKSNENRVKRCQLDYKNADFDSIRADVAATDWDTMLIGNTYECWSIFKATIKELERKYVPMKPVSAKTKKAIWMTPRSRKLVAKKRLIYAKHKDKHHPAVVKANNGFKSSQRG